MCEPVSCTTGHIPPPSYLSYAASDPVQLFEFIRDFLFLLDTRTPPIPPSLPPSLSFLPLHSFSPPLPPPFLSYIFIPPWHLQGVLSSNALYPSYNQTPEPETCGSHIMPFWLFRYRRKGSKDKRIEYISRLVLKREGERGGRKEWRNGYEMEEKECAVIVKEMRSCSSFILIGNTFLCHSTCVRTRVLVQWGL